MSSLRESALSYAMRGWRVFPLHGFVNGACTCGRSSCSSPGKHPLVRRGLYEATTDMAKIRSWWHRWRSANVGIATGAASGIAVIDIDLPTALVSLNDLCVHDIAPTLTGLTGGGGLHLVYLCTDASLGNSASRLPGMDGELPGVDLRANGGYVVGPPSVHRSGGFYEWLDANANVDRPLPELSEEPRALVAGGETDAADARAQAKPCPALDRICVAHLCNASVDVLYSADQSNGAFAVAGLRD